MARNKKRPREDDASPENDNTDGVVITADGSPPQKKQQQRRSLFVRSLPATATTDSLLAFFSQSYPVKHATAVIDSATRKCKGYGFVTFADSEDAQRALGEFNGTAFEGRKLRIEVAEPRNRDVEDAVPGAVAAGQARPRSVPSAATLEAKAKRVKDKQEAQKLPRLIVRNLPWSVKKPEQLAKLFIGYGKVKHAVLPSKKPGLMSGFGFVVLKNREIAEKAIKGINGKDVDGRTLAVDWAVEKEVWEKETNPQATNGDTSGSKPTSTGSAEGTSALIDEDGEEGHNDEESDVIESDEGRQDSEDIDEDVSDYDDEAALGGEEDDEYDDDRKSHSQDDHSSTLFIRNLPFTTLDEDLREHFTTFGAIRYARVVMDPSTERPKGTGFVCFVKAEDALQCLKQSPKPNRDGPQQRKPGTTEASHSILQNEADDPSGKYTIDGRVLQLTLAVNKDEASRLTEEGIKRRGERDKDKRRLYLLSEGTISESSPLYETLSHADRAMREASAKQRAQLIRTNPSLHLSLTRLSVRNIPRSVTSKDLKALAREAVVGFAKDANEGKRQRLSKEELARGGEAMFEAEMERKKKGVGLVKQAKVVFEGREGGKVEEKSGGGRSRGYGFIEYYTHRNALMGLRWLNGHVLDYQAREAVGKGKAWKEDIMERKKRMIVEFAIENAQVVNRRSDRERRARDTPRNGEQLNGKTAGAGGRSLYLRGVRRDGKTPVPKRAQDVAKGAAKEPSKAMAGTEEKQAMRQRIIGKKRAVRRRKGAA